MGRGRRPVLIALGLVLVMGIASIYLRLWTIDYKISSSETELLRRQFDLASKEAMEESAEWRFRYDEEVERFTNCKKELTQVKDSLEKSAVDSTSINKNLEMLQKENMGLLERVETLKQELETEKLKCSMRQM